jgi:hypothetical protein
MRERGSVLSGKKCASAKGRRENQLNFGGGGCNVNTQERIYINSSSHV